MKIFFDFDGTLLDSRRRLYVLFKELVPQSQLSFAEYWELKRNKINHEALLQSMHPEVDFLAFEQIWLSNIEKKELLELDILFEYATATLEMLESSNKLYLLTARQSKGNLEYQLENLGIRGFFEKVLPTEHKQSKEQLLRENFDLSKEDIIVGDTGHDIMTGKNLGIKTIALTHGFMSRNMLATYSPDILLDKLNDIPNIIDGQKVLSR